MVEEDTAVAEEDTAVAEEDTAVAQEGKAAADERTLGSAFDVGYFLLMVHSI